MTYIKAKKHREVTYHVNVWRSSVYLILISIFYFKMWAWYCFLNSFQSPNVISQPNDISSPTGMDTSQIWQPAACKSWRRRRAVHLYEEWHVYLRALVDLFVAVETESTHCNTFALRHTSNAKKKEKEALRLCVSTAPRPSMGNVWQTDTYLIWPRADEEIVCGRAVGVVVRGPPESLVSQTPPAHRINTGRRLHKAKHRLCVILHSAGKEEKEREHSRPCGVGL